MPEQEELLTILRAKTDQSSFAQAADASEKFRVRYNAIRAEIEKTSRAIQQYRAASSQGLANTQGLAGMRALETQMSRVQQREAEAVAQTRAYSRTALEAARAEESLGAVIARGTETLRQSTAAEKQAAQTKRESAQASEKLAAANASTGKSPLRSVSTATSGLGGGIGMILPSVMPATMMGSTAARAMYGVQVLSAEMPKLRDQAIASAGGVGQMTASLAAGGLAIVGMTLAWNQFQKIINDSKAAVADYMAVQRSYAEIIATGTSGEVREAIKANEDRNKALIIERDALQKVMDEVDNLEGFDRQLMKLNDTLGLNLGGLEDVKDRLHDVNSEIGNNAAANEALTQGLADGATAAADMAAQMEGARVQFEEFSKAAVASIRQESELRASADKAVASATDPAEVQKEIAALNQEYQRSLDVVAALDKAYREGRISSEEYRKAMKEEEKTRTQLTDKIALWSGQVMGAAVRSSFEASTKDVAKRKQELVTGQRELENQYLLDTEATEKKRQQELTYAQQDFDRKRARDVTGHYADLARLDTGYYGKVEDQLKKMAAVGTETDQEKVKALTDFNRESLRQARDHARTMVKIENELNASVEGSIEDRNIAAAIEAARGAKTKAADEEGQYAEEKLRRDEDFKVRLAELDASREEKLAAGKQALEDLEKQHKTERDENIAAFKEQLRREDEDRRIAQDRQAEAWRQEDDLQQQHFHESISAYVDYWADVQQLEVESMASVTQYMENRLAGLQQQAASNGTSGSSALSAAYAKISTPLISQATAWKPTVVEWGGSSPLAGSSTARGYNPATFGSGAQSTKANNVSLQVNVPIQTTGDPKAIAKIINRSITDSFNQLKQQVQRLQS